MSVDLEAAINAFDRVEAALRGLDEVVSKMRLAAPRALRSPVGGAAAAEYERLRSEYARLLHGLRPCGGWVVTAVPVGLDDPLLRGVDPARAAALCVESAGDELKEYRIRFAASRLDAVRPRLLELVELIDACIAQLVQANASASVASVRIAEASWAPLRALVEELDRLGGSGTRSRDWGQLMRHLRFGYDVDLVSISMTDWPGVRGRVLALSSQDTERRGEALDLAVLAATARSGSVSTALSWSVLNDGDFERLIFALLSDGRGYDNVQWLMKTRAQDRGRDVSAWRAREDDLTDVDRERIFVQCKHWRARSVSPKDVVEASSKIALWEPPPVDVLIIATSGRFTADAVQWIDAHNQKRKRPRIEMWAESRLETLLNRRPHLIAQFGLR